jgi:hypothetical protein
MPPGSHTLRFACSRRAFRAASVFVSPVSAATSFAGASSCKFSSVSAITEFYPHKISFSAPSQRPPRLRGKIPLLQPPQKPSDNYFTLINQQLTQTSAQPPATLTPDDEKYRRPIRHRLIHTIPLPGRFSPREEAEPYPITKRTQALSNLYISRPSHLPNPVL